MVEGCRVCMHAQSFVMAQATPSPDQLGCIFPLLLQPAKLERSLASVDLSSERLVQVWGPLTLRACACAAKRMLTLYAPCSHQLQTCILPLVLPHKSTLVLHSCHWLRRTCCRVRTRGERACTQRQPTRHGQVGALLLAPAPCTSPFRDAA